MRKLEMKKAWYYRPLVWVSSIILAFPVVRFKQGTKITHLTLGDLIFQNYPNPIEDITKSHTHETK